MEQSAADLAAEELQRFIFVTELETQIDWDAVNAALDASERYSLDELSNAVEDASQAFMAARMAREPITREAFTARQETVSRYLQKLLDVLKRVGSKALIGADHDEVKANINRWIRANQNATINGVQGSNALERIGEKGTLATSDGMDFAFVVSDRGLPDIPRGALKMYSFIANRRDKFQRSGEGEDTVYQYEFPFSEYCETMGLHGRGARQAFDRAVKGLSMVEVRTPTSKAYLSLIAGAVRPAGRGNRSPCTIALHPLQRSWLESATPMLFPSACYQIDDHCNPWAWNLVWKLMENYHLRFHAKGSHERAAHEVGKAETKLSVAKLIAVTGLPRSVENFREVQQIIRPFERDLNALVKLGVGSWHYLLPDERKAKPGTVAYAEFKTAFIVFTFKDFDLAAEEKLQQSRINSKK